MRLLLLAVVVAQALDALTFAAMPRVAEVNPLAASMHTEAAWLAKALLVVLVVAIQPALRPRYAAVGEAVALLAFAAGCIGAGSNMAVLTTHAAEAPRSVQEPAPIASDAKGIEQGESSPAAPGRFPAPRLAGRASWYPAAGSVAAAGPALRRALGRHWRGTWVRVTAGDRSVLVQLRDWCQCYRGQRTERLLDLSDDNFSVLAPLSAGLIDVRVGSVRLEPPATDVAP